MDHELVYEGQNKPLGIKIDQGDIDKNGHVHFKIYPWIFEKARLQWMPEGEAHGRVTEMDIKYRLPVYAGDVAFLMTTSQVGNMMRFEQRISQKGKTTTESYLILALLPEEELLDETENINYKEYPKIFDDARFAFMKEREVNLAELEHDYGLYGIITTMNLKYGSQLRGKDMRITNNVSHTRIGAIFDQKVESSDIQSRVEMILIDSRGKPKAIPPALAQNLGELRKRKV